MALVTASLTAVLMSPSSSRVGSSWAAEAAAADRAKAALADREGKTRGQADDLDGALQLLHPLPQAEKHRDAGGVHKGQPRAVHDELAGEDLVDFPLQVPDEALYPVMVDVPLQGDGEHAVVGGVGDRHKR